MPAAPPVFFYDLGDPECYLVAEQITPALGVVAEWEPVLGADLGVPPRPADPQEVAGRAASLGLQPLRWPDRWPPDTRRAMLAATYAKRAGRTVSFSLAGFRQAFAAGRDLSQLDTVLIAAAACELHPSAVIKALELRSVREALDAATSRATAAEVAELPAILIDGRLFAGSRALAEAAAEIGARAG
ncbi:MAG TPA: DsbA family protein [Solirubrobacteraceae bacterium]|nr:DsbA family protein [Solirubrobacteraceae bacterium]